MHSRAIPLALTLILVLSAGAWAQGLPTAKPENVGLSSERLDRVAQTIRADVEKGRLPGAVVLIARKGQVAYFEAFGFRDKAAGAPMGKDAIFRIYSMTKPFTSVAVMMLVEEGRIQLTDPVSKYLPQLTKLQVGVEKPDALGGADAVARPRGPRHDDPGSASPYVGTHLWGLRQVSGQGPLHQGRRRRR